MEDIVYYMPEETKPNFVQLLKLCEESDVVNSKYESYFISRKREKSFFLVIFL